MDRRQQIEEMIKRGIASEVIAVHHSLSVRRVNQIRAELAAPDLIICNRCGKEGPRSRNRSKVCKTCYAAEGRKRYWNNRERYLAVSKAYHDKMRADPERHQEYLHRQKVKRVFGSTAARKET